MYLKPKLCFVVIWLSSYATLFFHFSIFFLLCFFLFFDVFCTLPHNQENHDSKQISLKYDFNMRLLKSSVNWGKNIDFSLCIQALYVKAIRPYPKHLGISYCMCNVLKASLKVKQTGVDITCFFKMQNHLQQNIRKVFRKRLMEPVKHLSCSLLQKS